MEDDKLTGLIIPLVNTQIIKQLKAMKPIMDDNFSVPKIYKDSEDKALSKICLERHFE
jgi:N utilization substance protein B